MQQTSSNTIQSKGFYAYLTAQFLSALADNALLFAAIALLAQMEAPKWHQPLLLQFFVLAYIVLAPIVGAFADSKPKGQVMFISNGIKLAKEMGKDKILVLNICGRGDKDIDTAEKMLGDSLDK